MPGPRVTSDDRPNETDRVALRTAEEDDRQFLQRGVANAALRQPLGDQ